MMKKMLVCLMIAVLLMLSAASALEGFTLRNGVQFGDAIDQAYGPLRNCAEWVHDCGDGHYLKIELVQFNDGERAAQPTFSIHVGYTYFTDAQLKESPHQMEQDDASILSDI